jgi:leucyl/phenylalanyl-tRNA--protein transferase
MPTATVSGTPVAVYLLDESGVFPPPEHAEPSGLLAVGGDLAPTRLLRAYREGIFPWYSGGEPILWFSPDPRAVLDPMAIRLGRSTRRALAHTRGFRVSADLAFEEVIDRCAGAKRPGQDGTWITPAMRDAYVTLHRLGFAHSVETWDRDHLVGGVYGVGVGAYFSGESMFHDVPGASIRALVSLLVQLAAWRVRLFDCQMHTPHVGRLGAELWPRRRFLETLAEAISQPTRRGLWRLDVDPPL